MHSLLLMDTVCRVHHYQLLSFLSINVSEECRIGIMHVCIIYLF